MYDVHLMAIINALQDLLHTVATTYNTKVSLTDSTADIMQQTQKSGVYIVSQKKGATLTMPITLSILDRFAKFFHCCKEQ